MDNIIKIGKRVITETGRPYFIADIGANHDGDIKRAFKLIELAKETGADAAKFQNFKAELIVSKAGFDAMPKQTHQAAWKNSVFEVYQKASLKDEWTERLKEKCLQVDIEYMTSPYDFHSADLADQYSNAFKIGSGDITWPHILSYIAKKQKPIFLATGASDENDVERAVKEIQIYNTKLILMQCNTNYTVDRNNFHSINLRVLSSYKEKYPGLILGLSDHTPGHTTVLGAIALGARVIEKHFTDDNTRTGPDHKFAMNPKTWHEMVEASNDLFEALGDGKKKIEDNEKESVIVQQRAVYAVKDMEAGEVITENSIFPLRPLMQGCIYPYETEKIIGKRINKGIKKDTCIVWEDIK